MITQTNGPILYVDDDEDNQFLFGQAVKELAIPNKIHFFLSGQTALDYLRTTDETPLLILSDLNMPGMNGTELYQEINADAHLKGKAIPFIFYTTEASPTQIKELYKQTVQGFYIKPLEFTDLKRQIMLIVSYWQACLHPSTT